MLNNKLPIIGVMGSGRNTHTRRAEAVGRMVADLGAHLLTGGGAGVMAAASRAFFNTRNRRGLVIGIIPGAVTEKGYAPKNGYPNQWVEIPIFTHLPLSGAQGTQQMSRNHINILSSNVIIALPGSSGTASEIRLALDHGKPVVAFLERRHQIPDLPPEILVEADIEPLKALVVSALGNRLS